MMVNINKKIIENFNWIDLHKQVGQLRISEPTDSDIQEGYFTRTVYFMDSKGKVYILLEEDIRE